MVKSIKHLLLSLLGLLLFIPLSVCGLAFVFNQTLMNRDFLPAEVAKIDISNLFQDLVGKQTTQQFGQLVSAQISQQVGAPIPPLNNIVSSAIDRTAIELAPWMKQQLGTLTYNVQDYVMGRSTELNLRIPMVTTKDTLSKNLKTALLSANELAALPQTLKEAAVNSVAQSVSSSLPDTLDLNSALGLTSALTTLRQYSGFYPFIFWSSLLLVIVIALGIFALTGSFKQALRSVGTNFFIDALFGYLGTFLSPYLNNLPGLPIPIQNWLPGFLNELSIPWKTFCIIVGLIGVVLLALSFVIKGKRIEHQTNQVSGSPAGAL